MVVANGRPVLYSCLGCCVQLLLVRARLCRRDQRIKVLRSTPDLDGTIDTVKANKHISIFAMCVAMDVALNDVVLSVT